LISYANITPSAKILLAVPKLLQALLLPGSNHHRRITPTPPRRGIIHSLNIRPPLLDIRPQHSTIIRQQPVDFPLNVCSLRPDSTRTSKLVDLVAELGE
jgi:hypothetical protein